MEETVTVVGAGLAGCEAAWQLARRGARVRLHEMRPKRFTPAHATDCLAEVVGSNSFRSDDPGKAVGLLHKELRQLGSLILEVADEHRVPAGRALAVDRVRFSEAVQARIEADPRIDLAREESLTIPIGTAILAPGPFVRAPLAEMLGALCGGLGYHYYPSVPIVHADSLEAARVLPGSIYGDEGADYLNVVLSHEKFREVADQIRKAETMPLYRVESPAYPERLVPIEEMLWRARAARPLGPMKLASAAGQLSGHSPGVVLQLRREDREGTLYAVAGFRTRMRFAEQERILRMLPGLEKVRIARHACVRRHVYVRVSEGLGPHLAHRERPGLFLAGRIAGVTGKTESVALGLLAGINAAFHRWGERSPLPPATTALGSLARHVVSRGASLPVRVGYGQFPALDRRLRLPRQERNRRISERALIDLSAYARLVEARSA